MPTNRPFLANILVAFRSHSAIQQKRSATPGSPPRQAAASMQTSATQANQANQAGHEGSQTPQESNNNNNTNNQQQQPQQRARRRSSSSSTDGVMNALNGEKWWIGGRASDGQARFYQLQPVRHRSIDRISIDRLSI